MYILFVSGSLTTLSLPQKYNNMSFYFPFEKFPSTKFFQNVADLEEMKCCRNNEVKTKEFLKRGFF